MTKAESKLAALREKEQELKNQMAAIKAKVNEEKRAKETRQKILIGAMRLSEIKAGRYTRSQLRNDLDNYLSKTKDRELFDLPPKQQTT